MEQTILVVPAYNEARRLPAGAYRAFLDREPGVHILFVDDGSRDDTWRVMESLRAERPDRFTILRLPKNAGKAEAVRLGFLAALRTEADFIGFWDADLSTPLDALPSFLGVLRQRPTVEIVLGSRVRLMGRDIRRSPARHYSGRLAASLVSLVLDLPVYDTQCGAKLFRRTPTLPALFAEPLLARWVFDVEILARYLRAKEGARPSPLETIYEAPLDRWEEVGESKVKPWHFLRALLDLLRIGIRYRPRAARRSSE